MSDITINVEGLRSDKAELEKYLQQYTQINSSVKKGLESMENGLDSKTLATYSKQMQAVMSKVTSVENHLLWGIKVIEECIEKYQDVDTVLAKYADEMYDENGNVIAPATTHNESEHSDSASENMALTLQPNMGNYSMKQGDYYNMYATNSSGQKYHAGCMATCYAIGQSIVTGEPQDPMHFWNSSSSMANSREANVSDYLSYDSNIIFDCLNAGKPSLVHFEHGGTGGQHWVVVYGIHEGADINNLQNSDFLVVDPGTGQYTDLQSVMNQYKNSNLVGMKNFQ